MAITALPLHGIGLLFVSLLQSLELISPLLPGIPLTLHTGLSFCGLTDRFLLAAGIFYNAAYGLSSCGYADFFLVVLFFGFVSAFSADFYGGCRHRWRHYIVSWC